MTVSKLIAVIALAGVAACTSPIEISKPRAVDYADAGSTALFLTQGYVEANPIIGSAGNAAPVAALGMKVVARTLIDNSGASDDQKATMNKFMSATSVGATCNNLTLVAGAANPALIGLLCFGGYMMVADE